VHTAPAEISVQSGGKVRGNWQSAGIAESVNRTLMKRAFTFVIIVTVNTITIADTKKNNFFFICDKFYDK
jgi:hypothetical protein